MKRPVGAGQMPLNEWLQVWKVALDFVVNATAHFIYPTTICQLAVDLAGERKGLMPVVTTIIEAVYGLNPVLSPVYVKVDRFRLLVVRCHALDLLASL
jgi:hypothetical protein